MRRVRIGFHPGKSGGSETLECERLSVRFGGVLAVDSVDLRVSRGEIRGLIGPNGAGKTSLMNAIVGLVKPTAGKVFLEGADITGISPSRLARRGVARTFQDVRLFRGLTVRENLEAGAVGVGATRREARTRADLLLEEARLVEKSSWPAAALSYGEEQRLAIARAVAMSPRFLMLDEPAAGLNERETDELHETILGLRATRGYGILIVEHDMRLMMKLCDALHVLDNGRTLCVGAPEIVRTDERVLAAYLGRVA
jgi:branched-chain amino acid transport system ATP-binding protein